MKSTSFFTLLATFFIVNLAQAQVPQAINYQAVIRTDSGFVVPNKSVNIRLSIQDGLTTPPQYIEQHTVTTNQFGLVTLSIGKGAPLTGLFTQINWAIGEKFLKTEVDINRTSTYSLIGIQQFLSVPYALYAERAGNVQAANDGWKVVGNAATTGQFLGTTNAQDLKIFTNNLQRAAFSADGNVGIGVNIPAALLHTNGTLRFAGLTRDDAKNNLLAVDNLGNVGWRDAASFLGASGWLLNGNTATASNYIGTNNSQDLRIYTEGSQKMVLKTTGNVGIGTNTPTSKLTVEAIGDGTAAVEDRILMKLDNKSTSFAASTNMQLTGGNSSAFTMFSHVSPTYTVANQADYGQIWNTGKGIILRASPSSANPNHDGNIRFFTGFSPDVYNNLFSNERMRIEANGNIGIGTRTPSAQLHNLGTVRFEGLSTNNSASQIIVADASGNLALRDVSTLPTGGGGGGTGWLLSGNTATASSYIGTNNAQDLRVYTEGSQKMVVTAAGNVGIGTNTPDYKLNIEQPDGVTAGIDDGRTLMQLHNKSSTYYATTNLRIKTGNTQNVTMVSHYGPTYTLYPGFADYGLMLSTGAGLMMQAPGGNIRFMTGPAPNSVGIYDRMVVTKEGNVGIGTSNPDYRLRVETNSDVTGSQDRLQMQLHNASTNNEALAGLGISSGNSGTNTWLEHVGANYSVYDAAYSDFKDLGYLASTGQGGLMMMSYLNSSKMRFAVGTANNIPVTRMSLTTTGLGIGTETPKAKLEITNGDVYVNDSTKGIILKSPNGGCWRVTVDNSGNFVRTSITCPQ